MGAAGRLDEAPQCAARQRKAPQGAARRHKAPSASVMLKSAASDNLKDGEVNGEANDRRKMWVYARLSAPPLVLAVPTVLKQHEGINSTASDNDGWKIERARGGRVTLNSPSPCAAMR